MDSYRKYIFVKDLFIYFRDREHAQVSAGGRGKGEGES